MRQKLSDALLQRTKERDMAESTEDDKIKHEDIKNKYSREKKQKKQPN
jgi:hypothetical protein